MSTVQHPIVTSFITSIVEIKDEYINSSLAELIDKVDVIRAQYETKQDRTRQKGEPKRTYIGMSTKTEKIEDITAKFTVEAQKTVRAFISLTQPVKLFLSALFNETIEQYKIIPTPETISNITIDTFANTARSDSKLALISVFLTWYSPTKTNCLCKQAAKDAFNLTKVEYSTNAYNNFISDAVASFLDELARDIVMKKLFGAKLTISIEYCISMLMKNIIHLTLAQQQIAVELIKDIKQRVNLTITEIQQKKQIKAKKDPDAVLAALAADENDAPDTPYSAQPPEEEEYGFIN